MQALIIVDAQNEFSADGLRAVPDHALAIVAIQAHLAQFRAQRAPIAWVQHLNLPHEYPAFEPGSWGAEFTPGFGPSLTYPDEPVFTKTVFGAFSGSDLGAWLDKQGVDSVLIAGFYTHMCVSTTSREALMRGLEVQIDPAATGSTNITHPQLGQLSAEESRRIALLHLAHMGVTILEG